VASDGPSGFSDIEEGCMFPQKTLLVVLVAAAAACSAPVDQPPPASDPADPARVAVTANRTHPPALLERVTPVLAVDDIEPVIPFWAELGFSPVNPSYEDGELIYMGFNKDGLEIHYQVTSRFERDMRMSAGDLSDNTSLIYLTVNNLDAIVERLGGAEIVIPRRKTEWGADEIYVKEPGGNIIGFATFGRN